MVWAGPFFGPKHRKKGTGMVNVKLKIVLTELMVSPYGEFQRGEKWFLKSQNRVGKMP
jgi:hypothetical protein